MPECVNYVRGVGNWPETACSKIELDLLALQHHQHRFGKARLRFQEYAGRELRFLKLCLELEGSDYNIRGNRI